MIMTNGSTNVQASPTEWSRRYGVQTHERGSIRREFARERCRGDRSPYPCRRLHGTSVFPRSL